MGSRHGSSPETELPAARADAGKRRHRVMWAVAAVLVAVLGTAASYVAAKSEARSDGTESRAAFARSAGEVASTLQLAIQREEDLVVSAGGFMLRRARTSSAEFRAWSTSIRALQRFPELESWGLAVIIPAAELPAYAARAAADPVSPLGPDGKLRLVPSGPRPFYCLSPIGQQRDGNAGTVPAGFDSCAGPAGAQVLASRDSGQGEYAQLNTGSEAALSVIVPLYRGGSVPLSVAARRHTFIGWVMMRFNPAVVLERALQEHPRTAVFLRYTGNNSPSVVFYSGQAPAGAVTDTIDLHNGWTVQASGAVHSGRILSDRDAIELWLGGSLLSLLLSLLIVVLSTGRSRALRLADNRTAQLRGAQAQLLDNAHQAGMAEIATNVLHNVGNVLNSVNVSANIVNQKVRGSKLPGLSRVVTLMQQHNADLGDYVTTDSRGKQLPAYLKQLSTTLTAERDSVLEDLQRLTTGVSHIKEIVKAQQTFAGISGLIESAPISDLIEDALRMSGATTDTELTIIRDYPDNITIPIDRHRTLLILLNLVSNAQTAMAKTTGRGRQLHIHVDTDDNESLSVMVADTGPGILPENLDQVFVHGFTTHMTGHGFGLHSSAIAATEMGGTLTVHNGPDNTGAVFTLQIPLSREAVTT